MEVPDMLHSHMLTESHKLDDHIDRLHAQLQTLPEGKLLCVHNGKYHKWFQSNGQTQSYIPKKERHLAEQLALKKYLQLQLKDIKNEKKAIDAYLKRHTSSQAEELLTHPSEYQQLLTTYFHTLSEELLEWSKAPYDHNPKYPEQLTHQTASGNIVRSKSEALINMLLYMHKIPFRYECALYLDSTVFYPDFSIRHPKTGQLFYWEHFGLIDDPVYANHAGYKLQKYLSHGIIPTINLITTYETSQHPLTTQIIEKNIQDFFL